MKTDLEMITYDNSSENTIKIQTSEFNGEDCNIRVDDKEKNGVSMYFKKEELRDFIDYLEFFYSKM